MAFWSKFAAQGLAKIRLDNPCPHARSEIAHPTTKYQNFSLYLSVLLLSIIAYCTVASPINHFKSLDPIFYQSYIHSYNYMIEMFGYTYYSTRISWIFVARWLSDAFGPTAGYFLSHLMFLSAAAISFAILVNRFFPWQIAIFGGAWFCFSPLIMRSFAHDYIDGPALAYGMAGMAYVLTASPRALWMHVFGGAAFALSFNAYPLAAIFPITTIPAWLYLRRRSGHLSNIAHAGCALAGFVLAYLFLGLLLKHAFALADRDFELIPLTTMSLLYKGGATQWFVPLIDIFGIAQEFNRGYLLFATSGVVFLAIGFVRGNASQMANDAVDGIVVTAILAVGTLASFLSLHFWLRGGAIALPYAYVFAMPACGLASCALLYALCSRLNLNLVTLCAVVALAAIWVTTHFWINPSDLLPNLLWLAVGSILAASGILVRLIARRWIALIGIVSIASFPFSFMGGYPIASTQGMEKLFRIATYVPPMYDRTRFGAERSLRTGIFALLDDAKALIAPGKVPGLWYKNGTNFADEVGSAFLWLYTRVSPPPDSGQPGMPVIDAATRKQLDEREYLILIGKDVPELEQARTELRNAGYRFEVLRERSVGDHAFSFVYTILHKSNIDMAAYAPVDHFTLERYLVKAGRLWRDEAGSVHLETDDQKWGYAAFYPVREAVHDAPLAIVELEVQVQEGTIGIAAADAAEQLIAPEAIVRAWDRTRTIIIPFKRADNAKWLVLRNAGRGKAKVVLRSARTLLPRESSQLR